MTGGCVMRGRRTGFAGPLYSFGVLSDVHVDRTSQDAEGDLRKAFSAFRNRGITRVCCCGDISTNHTEDELQAFKAVKDEFPGMTFRSCTGNHDAQFTDTQWLQYVGHGFSDGGSIRACVETVRGDSFVFLPIARWEDARPYSYGNDGWADAFGEVLAAAGPGRIFLFMHFPLNSESASFQYPGLKIGQHYGFGSGSADNSAIAAKIRAACERAGAKGVTVFSGHSHYEFGVQGINAGFRDAVFLRDGKFAHVHVPSLAVPRDKDMNTIRSGSPELQPAQGYVVDVYSDHVRLTGLEFNMGIYAADRRRGLVRAQNRYSAPFEDSGA